MPGRRSILLVVLLAGYALVVGGVPTIGGPRVFDPLAPRPHVVERLIVARRFTEALPLAIELARDFPREPQVLSWIATARSGPGDRGAEAGAWDDYVNVSPTASDACPAWPEAHAAAGHADRALTAYERCAQLEPRDPSV